MVLRQIKEEYFEPIREWSSDYEVLGEIMGKQEESMIIWIQMQSIIEYYRSDILIGNLKKFI